MTAHRYSPAPPFVPSLLHQSAGALRHVRGFPPLGLLRPLRPTTRPSTDDAPTRTGALGGRRRLGSLAVVPTFTADRSRREVPSYAPAISPRLRRRHSPWPPAAATLTAAGVPNTETAVVLVRIADQPVSTGLELPGNLRGVITLVPRVHLLLMLAGPRPSGSAGLSRRCRGCMPPSPASPG